VRIREISGKEFDRASMLSTYARGLIKNNIHQVRVWYSQDDAKESACRKDRQILFIPTLHSCCEFFIEDLGNVA
jgi:hypothetical protein